MEALSLVNSRSVSRTFVIAVRCDEDTIKRHGELLWIRGSEHVIGEVSFNGSKIVFRGHFTEYTGRELRLVANMIGKLKRSGFIGQYDFDFRRLLRSTSNDIKLTDKDTRT